MQTKAASVHGYRSEITDCVPGGVEGSIEKESMGLGMGLDMGMGMSLGMGLGLGRRGTVGGKF